MGKIWVSISKTLPIPWVCYIFPHCGKFGTKNLWGNPSHGYVYELCIPHMLKYTIGWESNRKKHHRYGESMSINFPDFPRTIGFVVFSRNLWVIYGETHIHAFPALMLNPYMALVNFFLCLMINVIMENLLATFSIKMIHKKCI